ncbi:XdhC family protein [Pantoea cypripedii]|uniref:XdhC family protein n=1 Tax=Pantoea cypripedii TaxID=55209 RepID=UPI001FCA4772|nr:XdhC family protein [Pantoea cypripedii]
MWKKNFLQRIASGQFHAPSQKVIYGDGGLTPDKALPCGGILSILVERLTLSEATCSYLERMEAALLGAVTLRKFVRLPDACSGLEETSYISSTTVVEQGDRLELCLAATPQVVIAGLSEVALACAGFSLALGFQTVVCEVRAEMLANYQHRLPAEILLKEVFPAKWLEENAQHPCRAVVALTHDPRIDDLTLMEAVQSHAFYIGAMGSVKNSQNRLARMKTIGGLSDREIDRIHAPIGLPINSKTPAEIALAVMADIVACKNSVTLSRQ